MAQCQCLTRQEEMIELFREGKLDEQYNTKALRRAVTILNRFANTKPIFEQQRPRYFTESMRQTVGQPLVLRWAKAMRHLVEHMEVFVDRDQIFAGAVGQEGRWGILYPELDGPFFKKAFASDDCPACTGKAPFVVPLETARLARTEWADFWEEFSFLKEYEKKLPEYLHHVTYKDDLNTKFIVAEWLSCISGMNWTPDWGKVLSRGMKFIRQQAQDHLDRLDRLNPEHITRQIPFYEAVIMTCDNLKLFAGRHADLCEKLAGEATDPERRQELLTMAGFCRRVPEEPAESLWEALQSLWLMLLYLRYEAKFGSMGGMGRMDQYLYPFYKADKEKGLIDDERALELFNCYWACTSKLTDVYVTAIGSAGCDGFAHWDSTTVGGQTADGRDATNELSYLLIRCGREFPFSYPDLAARVHSTSPQEFLWAVAESIKDGAGYPKLLNDEEIVSTLTSMGASRSAALDYCVSGCAEVRMPNVDTNIVPVPAVSYPAMLECVMYNGRLPFIDETLYGLETGEPEDLKTWEDFWEAFKKQHDYFMGMGLLLLYIGKQMYGKYYASPLASSLHDLCMADARDLHEEFIKDGVDIAFVDGNGLATLVDSLSAIKKMVYEEKRLSLRDVVEACRSNFAGAEGQRIRAILKQAPAFGNNDDYTNGLAFDIDTMGTRFFEKYNPVMGINVCLRLLTATGHIPQGRVIGALPSGRLAGKPLSQGGSATQGADVNGPGSLLLANRASKNYMYSNRCARLMNIKLSPSVVSGDRGTEKLISFIRTWCALKLWHVQFNIINRETMEAAQEDPDTYRNLMVRVGGYSAYFIELNPNLQDEIISRTEYSTL